MPLILTTTSPTHDLTILIDNEPVRLHIARFTRDQAIAFRCAYRQHQRATLRAGVDDAKLAAAEAAGFEFGCQAIVAYVTVEPGDIVVDGVAVVTGQQCVDAFYSREDVIKAAYQAIYSENCGGAELKKTFAAEGFFSPGSAPKSASTPTAAGAAPAPTASAASPSPTATSAAATDGHEPSPSGEALTADASSSSTPVPC